MTMQPMQVALNQDSGLSSVKAVPCSDVDLLQRFEEVRIFMELDAHPSLRPTAVVVPNTHLDNALRVVEYMENAGTSLDERGKPAFQAETYWKWAEKGSVNWHPRYNAISTGIDVGAVILKVDAHGDFHCVIEWTDGRLWAYDYVLGILRYLEGHSLYIHSY